VLCSRLGWVVYALFFAYETSSNDLLLDKKLTDHKICSLPWSSISSGDCCSNKAFTQEIAVRIQITLNPPVPEPFEAASQLIDTDPLDCSVSAVGFAAAFGGGGAAVFPFAVGAIAEAKGVQVLQPIALALIAVILALWCLLPGGFKKRGLEEARKEREEGGAGVLEEGEKRWSVRRLRRKVGIA